MPDPVDIRRFVVEYYIGRFEHVTNFRWEVDVVNVDECILVPVLAQGGEQTMDCLEGQSQFIRMQLLAATFEVNVLEHVCELFCRCMQGRAEVHEELLEFSEFRGCLVQVRYYLVPPRTNL